MTTLDNAAVANASTPTQPADEQRVTLPSGWTFVPQRNGSIAIAHAAHGGCIVSENPTSAREIPEAILFELAKSLMARGAFPSAFESIPMVKHERAVALVAAIDGVEAALVGDSDLGAAMVAFGTADGAMRAAYAGDPAFT